MREDTTSSTNRRTLLKASGAAGLAALAGCISQTGNGNGNGDGTGPYSIGMVDSLTGSLSAFGERNQRGKDLALARVNDVGISDRGYVLDQGTVRFEGTADDLLDNEEVSQLYLGG